MAAVPFKVKAVYEYTSNHEDDLPFEVGQIITVVEEEDDDWYSGEYVGDDGVKKEGMFPRNFVEKYEPTAPPRPTRTRPKKETEPEPEPVAAPAPPVAAHAEPSPTEDQEEPEAEPVNEPPVVSPPPPHPATDLTAPTIKSPPAAPVLKPAEFEPAPVPPPAALKVAESAGPSAQRPSKPAKPGPPPVSDKPTSSSFKDRIAAFNKPAAAPIAPFKPSGLGGSGFVKKPFVAPPPSRNAYIPPPQQAPTAKVYKRDEDPEIKAREAEAQDNAEKAGLAPAGSAQEGEQEDQPKPTSLKERIALLQKQQAEAAQRHSEAASKKEKPKRPQKKRTESQEPLEETQVEEGTGRPSLEHRTTEDTLSKKSLDEPRPPRQPLPTRRKSSRDPETVQDGNEADMSGAGDTTEGQEDDLTEREDSDEKSRNVAREPFGTASKEEALEEDEGADEEEEEEEEEEDEEAAEIRRKEELRARMAKMSGGMGMYGMFGAPPVPGASAPPKRKKSAATAERRSSEVPQNEPVSPRMAAPPVPVPGMMALPGMGSSKKAEDRDSEVEKSEDFDEEDTEDVSPSPTSSKQVPPELPSRESGGPPPVPGGRPAPPPVPAESRPPPPPPPAAIKSPSIGSESDDEQSDNGRDRSPLATPRGEAPPTTRAPPPLPLASPPLPVPTSPRPSGEKRSSYIGDDDVPTSPSSSTNKRASRPPPPIPGAAPALPSQTRPPPPPPPGGPMSRSSTADQSLPSPTKQASYGKGEEEAGEVTEYEGDYDTDIASSVPHKDALKSHARESSLDDSTPVRSPVSDVHSPSSPPPIPSAAAPRAVPPPIPSQPPPPPRASIDAPRAAPPPPPPSKETAYQHDDDEYDPYNYSAPKQEVSAPGVARVVHRPEEDFRSPEPEGRKSMQAAPDRRVPPPAPPSIPPRAPPRQSLDAGRPSGRRSMDQARPSIETGFVANDIDLAGHTSWWSQAQGLPPVLQGRKDIYTEAEESEGAKEVYILYQDYSQTVITVRFDPQNPSDVELQQRHEGPPRTLRQDQLEQSYEQFGRQIAAAISGKKDAVVGDGTPHALISELLKPFKEALHPVGTRAYGALVYSNLANASTQQFDEIRAGDIVSIRNAKFQGKHGPMHAKYSTEVGKPDHVAVVAEWDGTKKKVRAYEQGRESKKVKVESFKLDDLRSGEVKIWRVMPRSWVGWDTQT